MSFTELCRLTADVKLGLEGYLESGRHVMRSTGPSGEDVFFFSSKSVLGAMEYTKDGGAQALKLFVPPACKTTLGLLLSPEDIEASKIVMPRITHNNRAEIWISETGVFKLAIRSGQPCARQFQDFVTEQLLPWVRGIMSRGAQLLLQEQSARIHSLEAQMASLELELQTERATSSLQSRPSINRPDGRREVPVYIYLII